MKMGRMNPKKQAKGRKFIKPEPGEGTPAEEKGESPKFEKKEDSAMGMMIKHASKGKK